MARVTVRRPPARFAALILIGASACGSPVVAPPVTSAPIATDIPLTTRAHMDAATQAAYDKLRARQGWLIGVGALGTAANAFLTVPPGTVQARWTELYGSAAGSPAMIEWEMAERNSPAATRDWAGVIAFANAGGLPWIMTSFRNFTVPYAPGMPGTLPQGGMNDTRNRAAGVLSGGTGHAAFVAYLQQLAAEVKAVGRPVVLRPLHEGNGGWFWWGGNAADYTALWTLMFQTFAQAGVRNAIWLWAAADICSATTCNAAGFYPGDAQVDILGVDLYFTAPVLSVGALATVGVLESLGADKPIVIAELGPAARADFWQQAPTAFASIKRFRGFSLWFARGWSAWGGVAGTGSLIDGTTDAATRAAFTSVLSDARMIPLARWVQP